MVNRTHLAFVAYNIWNAELGHSYSEKMLIIQCSTLGQIPSRKIESLEHCSRWEALHQNSVRGECSVRRRSRKWGASRRYVCEGWRPQTPCHAAHHSVIFWSYPTPAGTRTCLLLKWSWDYRKWALTIYDYDYCSLNNFVFWSFRRSQRYRHSNLSAKSQILSKPFIKDQSQQCSPKTTIKTEDIFLFPRVSTPFTPSEHARDVMRPLQFLAAWAVLLPWAAGSQGC